MADPTPYPGTPRWVKVFGIVVVIVILLVVAVMFIGGGEHGPGRHAPSGEAGGRVVVSVFAEDHDLRGVGPGWS